MSPGPKILQAAGRVGGPAGDAAPDERATRRIIPRLRADGRRRRQQRDHEGRPAHLRGISRRLGTWASIAALLAACTDLLPPDQSTVTTADLVVLGLAPEAPAPAAASFYVLNGATTVRTLRHADAFSTLYLELRFDPGALASLNGTPLSSADSVLVTVTPLAGEYGFTLSPAGLVFTEGVAPTAVFSFGRYADPSVADGLFATPEGYVAALEVWREAGFDEWVVAAGSGPAGVDEVGASLEAGGRYWLAAALQ